MCLKEDMGDNKDTYDFIKAMTAGMLHQIMKQALLHQYQETLTVLQYRKQSTARMIHIMNCLYFRI